MIYLTREFAWTLHKKANFKRFFFAVVFILCLDCWQSANAQIISYPPISAKKNRTVNPLSPDPIINYTWANPKATDGLESYQLQPVSCVPSASQNFNIDDFNKNSVIVVNGKGDLRFDFGQTNAGWLEFDSPDFNGKVEMSISEYNQPPNYSSNYPPKTLSPKKHGNTYRLELNSDLYEGVRFGWIHVRSFSKSWHITGVQLVCQ